MKMTDFWAKEARDIVSTEVLGTDNVLKNEILEATGIETADSEISLYSTKGMYIGAFKSNSKSNEAYFINDDIIYSFEFQIGIENAKSDIERSDIIKSYAAYYIGANTRAALKEIANVAEKNGENFERGFILYLCESYPNCQNKELLVHDVSDYALTPSDRSAKATPFGDNYLHIWKQGQFSYTYNIDGVEKQISGYFIMHGHTHGFYSIKESIANYPSWEQDKLIRERNVPSDLNKPSYNSIYGLMLDYEDIVFENGIAHPAIVATHFGYTIYATMIDSTTESSNIGQVYDYKGIKIFDGRNVWYSKD